MLPRDAPRLSEWLTASDVADALGVSRQTVNTMINGGEFETLHTVGLAVRPLYLVRREEVLAIARTRNFRRR